MEDGANLGYDSSQLSLDAAGIPCRPLPFHRPILYRETVFTVVNIYQQTCLLRDDALSLFPDRAFFFRGENVNVEIELFSTLFFLGGNLRKPEKTFHKKINKYILSGMSKKKRFFLK